MKFCKKVLSVLLSLALCGSMAAPAFAASFADLQAAASGNDGDKENPEQYARHEDGTCGITAWTDGDTRHVELHENVDREPTYTYSPAGEKEPNGGYEAPIDISKDVTIDTNGYDINGQNNGGNIFNVNKDASLTVNAEKGGVIKGGSDPEGGAVHVYEGGSFEMDGGELSGNKADSDTWNGDTIDGNGGAIYVETGGTATLKDTVVTGNEADVNGGAIYAEDGAEVILEGKTEFSNNGTDDVYLEHKEDGTGAVLSGEDLDESASKDVVWTDAINGGEPVPVMGRLTSKNGSLSLKWTDPEPSEPANPGTGGNGNTGDTGTTPPVVEIEDPDTPMAEGPVSCAEFIYKLWLLDGEPAPLDDRGLPAAVSEDHEYAEAIAWAVSADVATIETFDPEELLTVDLARGFLINFAAYADMVMPELTTLIGDDDDLVLNTDDVLAEFFGRELDA